jgi:adenylate kinase
MKRLGFNIVMLGMIASGKDTQANILKKKYALRMVETGVYSRKLLKEKGKNGDLARKTVGKGLPLPTKLLQQFLKDEIAKKPKNKNLLFMGGRLKPEAELIKKIMTAGGEKLLVFYVSLPDKEVYKRSLSRSTGNMKEVFKVLDTKNLIAKRIKWHKDEVINKTLKYYQTLGILKKINGNQPIPKVTKDILKAIEQYSKTRV